MNSIIKICAVIIILLNLINVVSASVTYTDGNNEIIITDTTTINNISLLYSELVSLYNESYTKTNILNETSSKVWWSNGKIAIPNAGNFYINSTDVDELRICNGGSSNAFAIDGYVTLNNVTVISWNRLTDSMNDYENGAIIINYNEMHDTELRGFKYIFAGYLNGHSIENLSYSNLIINHSRTGLAFQRAENIKLNGLTVIDGSPRFGNGIFSSRMNNSTLSNIVIINASNHLSPSSGGYGIQLSGSNNIVHDVLINGTAWSGTSFGGTDEMGSTNLTVYNMTIINSGHNGFEVEMNNIKVTNVTVINSDAHNFFTAGRAEANKFISNHVYESITSINPGSYGIQVGEGTSDVKILNSTFSGKAIYIFNSWNVTAINISQIGSVPSGGMGFFSTIVNSVYDNYEFCYDNKVIDSTFTNNSDKDFWIHNDDGIQIINTNWLTMRLTNEDYYESYYLDVGLINVDGSISSGQISINGDNGNVYSVDGYGNNKTTFQITATGHTPLPNTDRANSPAIAEYYRNSDGTYQEFSHTATITTPDDRTVTLTGITPDSSWYRADPNVPTYTITAIIPETDSTGPHITGFAPAEDNAFNTGDSKIFRIWTDESLDSMNWYLDGSLVSSDSLNYTWTATDGGHTIRFDGSNINGTVSQTWDINGGSGAVSPSLVTITPPTQTVAPNQPFTLTIPITPATPITGAQFDLIFDNSLATVTSVTEGNLLNQDGATTLFNSGTINNAAGTVTNTYGSILGETSVSSQGSFATISMTAGSTTGYLNLNLTNVKISDANSNAAPYTLTNTTVLIDTAPVLDSIGAKSVDEGSALTFTTTASDADGDSLTYSATNLPTGASFNTETGAFSWTPADGEAGTYMVTFEVTDGYISDSEAVTITVNDGNNAPVITTFVPANSLTFNELDVITVGIIASDADGDALTYNIKIDGVTKSTSSSYVWETDYSSAGSHTIDITVSDGIEQVTDQRTITINDIRPRWDVNEDGTVNVLDISIIGQKYGTSVGAPYPRWDVNQDGVVNVQDMALTGSHFGETVA